MEALLHDLRYAARQMLRQPVFATVAVVTLAIGIGANTVSRLAGLPAEVCSFDTNRQCGSSMETLHRITQSIMVGATECGIALGIERMGRQLGGGGRRGEAASHGHGGEKTMRHGYLLQRLSAWGTAGTRETADDLPMPV